MKAMLNNEKVYDFLASFFVLFGAYIDKCEININEVRGDIICKDDENEKQNFIWIITLEEYVLNNLKLLCDFLLKYNFVHGDTIIISEKRLELKLSELGWNVSDAKENIDKLCSIEVKMIDNGEEIDSFFLHF